MLKLKYEKRDPKDVNKLRSSGMIPAVYYGPKTESSSISIVEADFMRAYKQAGESTIVVLDGADGEHETLIQDIQFDVVTEKPLHVDFYAIERGKKLEVDVDLEFIGEAPAEKTLGGSVVKVMHKIEVECLPRYLVNNIEVSLESLVDFESQIIAKDIKLPEGLELITGPEEVIAIVQEPREEEPEEVEEVDMDSIEVEQKGKDESDEEGSEGEAKEGDK